MPSYSFGSGSSRLDGRSSAGLSAIPAPYVYPLRRNVPATRVRAATAITPGATAVRKHGGGTTPKAFDITLNAKSLQLPPFSKVGLVFGMCSLTPSGGDTAADDDAAVALAASAASAAATKAQVASGQGKLIIASDRTRFIYAVKAGTRPAALYSALWPRPPASNP